MEIRVLLYILYRRRVIFAVVLGFFLLSVGFLTLSAPESYEATAKITVEKTDKIGAIMTGLELSGLVLDTRVDDDVSFDTDIELLMIRPLLERLIIEMDLRDSDGEYFETSDFLDGGIKNKFKGEPSVSIKQYNYTALVSITANSTDPEQAANIANRLARLYKEERIARTKADFGEVKKNITKNLEEMRDDYYQKLQEYREFRQRTGVVSIDSTVTNLLNQIVGLENSRAEYQRNIAIHAETIAVSRQELEKTKKMWESVRELGTNNLMTDLRQRLATLSSEVAGIGVTLTKKHPDYRTLTAQADAITALLKDEPELSLSRKQFVLNPVYETLYQGISENVVDLKAMLVGLEAVDKQLAEYKERLLRLPDLQMDSAQLNMELSANSTIYSNILQYSLKIGLAESAAVSKIRLVEPAKVSDSAKPDFPKKGSNLVLGVIFGVFFAVATALVIDYSDDSIRETEQLRRLSNKVHLGSLPYSPSLTMRPNLLFRSPAKMTERLRGIRDSLLFEVKERSAGNLFLVTSATERGGASTTAVGLARMLAEQHGETLLVDLNLRSPSLGGLLKRPATRSGVIEALNNNGAIPENSPADSPVEGLSVLLAGTRQAEPGRLIDSSALAVLLAGLRQQFRYVIIDSPSLAFYHDAAIIAKEADAVVLVVRAAEITGTTVVHCLDKLRIVGDLPVGTVLNREGYSLSLHRLPWIAVTSVSELLRSGMRKFRRR
ncbi:MAG: hypothetical protein D3903_05165 [Candidatus Electrothrix sp. GM3_4]|nr:hypothetical protein [Candidatus Electrothrix sp. GM3_4]